MLPEKKIITYNDLSPTSKKLLIKKIGSTAAKRYRSVKLVSSFLKKKNYKAHYTLIAQAVSKGLVIDRVNSVIRFKQEKISKNFLDYMTQLRKMSKTKLIQSECKNIANQASIIKTFKIFFGNKRKIINIFNILQLYGKSCENVFERLKAKFCKSFWHYDRLQNDPGFKDVKIVTDDLVCRLFAVPKCAILAELSNISFFR